MVSPIVEVGWKPKSTVSTDSVADKVTTVAASSVPSGSPVLVVVDPGSVELSTRTV